jgi:hypothetical protein
MKNDEEKLEYVRNIVMVDLYNMMDKYRDNWHIRKIRRENRDEGLNQKRICLG